MARPRKESSEAQLLWRALVAEGTDGPALRDADGRARAWASLTWACAHETIDPLPVPVTAEASEGSAVLRVLLDLLAAPPAHVSLEERLAAAQWASALQYPPLQLIHARLLAESGRVREAISRFEALKGASSVFPEIPITAGRVLIACAGADSKLLHRAETWLLYAEHVAMDGSEEVEDEDDWRDDTESVSHEAVLDEAAQARLAEVWGLMAALYARLGDPKKAEMYRMRAGSLLEESVDEVTPEGLEPLAGELPDPTVLKPGDRTLIRRFLESVQFRALTAAQQEQAVVALPSFVSLGRLYLGLAPTRLDRYSLEELMLGLVPEKLVATLEEVAHLPAVLIAWIHFLGKSAQLRDGGRLVAVVTKCAGEMLANCRNPDLWGMAKTLAVQMAASGVDLDDASAVSRYLAGRSARLLAV